MNRNIRMLIMDVDGTLTDGKLYIGESGEVYKVFCVKDGLRIKQLPFHGITPVIITGRQSRIVSHRASEIGITELYQGVQDKRKKLLEIVNENNFNLENVAYIGDDENDLPCLRLCGLSACTADAAPMLKQHVDYVCELNGGNGAVREFIDYILLHNL